MKLQSWSRFWQARGLGEVLPLRSAAAGGEGCSLHDFAARAVTWPFGCARPADLIQGQSPRRAAKNVQVLPAAVRPTQQDGNSRVASEHGRSEEGAPNAMSGKLATSTGS